MKRFEELLVGVLLFFIVDRSSRLVSALVSSRRNMSDMETEKFRCTVETTAMRGRGETLSVPRPTEAAIASYPDIVRRELNISRDYTIMCGMAMGYADPDAVVNTFQPERIAVEDYATFHD